MVDQVLYADAVDERVRIVRIDGASLHLTRPAVQGRRGDRHAWRQRGEVQKVAIAVG